MNDDPTVKEAALAEFNKRAALAAREVGRERMALELEGRAIDAWVRADRVDAALALCREVVTASPGVVRTWCTLAWLDIGRGYFANACQSVDRYVVAAEQAGQVRLAVDQLRRMAEFAPDEEFRLHLAEKLLWLEDERTANEIFGLIYEERNGMRAPPPDDPGRRLVEACSSALETFEAVPTPEQDDEAGSA